MVTFLADIIGKPFSTKQHRDNFIFERGIKVHPLTSMQKEFELLLTQQLPNLKQQLDMHGIETLMYAYKWFLLFFAQEYNMADVLRLWDSIFCFFDINDREPINKFVLKFGIGIMSLLEPELEGKDMGVVLQRLVHPKVPLEEVLKVVVELLQVENEKESVYESMPLE